MASAMRFPQITFEDSVRKSQRLKSDFTLINRLEVLRKITGTYCNIYTKLTNALCGQTANFFNLKAGRYHRTSSGYYITVESVACQPQKLCVLK